MATVREIRARTSMSRYALAQAAGLSYQGLTNVETGAVEPKLKTLQQISAALAAHLGVPAKQVLDELTTREVEVVS